MTNNFYFINLKEMVFDFCANVFLNNCIVVRIISR